MPWGVRWKLRRRSMTQAAPVSLPEIPAKKGDTFGYFAVRQGHAVPFAAVLGLFFLFWNPHATTPVGGALWMLIPTVIIFGWYLWFTQVLPVVTAPIFESHFAVFKDLGASIWPPIVTVLMMILSWTMGTVEVAGFSLDIDMTKIEYGIALQVFIAFIIDASGTLWGLVKNRLASEEGLGRAG